MARSATEAARILMDIYNESFGNNLAEQFRISWERMRGICDTKKLGNAYLSEIVDDLNDLGFSLATFDDYLLVLNESDCSELRSVPGRIVEKYLPENEGIESEDFAEGADDVEWEDE